MIFCDEYERAVLNQQAELHLFYILNKPEDQLKVVFDCESEITTNINANIKQQTTWKIVQRQQLETLLWHLEILDRAIFKASSKAETFRTTNLHKKHTQNGRHIDHRLLYRQSSKNDKSKSHLFPVSWKIVGQDPRAIPMKANQLKIVHFTATEIERVIGSLDTKKG